MFHWVSQKQNRAPSTSEYIWFDLAAVADVGCGICKEKKKSLHPIHGPLHIFKGKQVPWQRRRICPSTPASPLFTNLYKKATNCALQSFFIKAYWPCWRSGHQQVSCRSLCQGLDGLPFCCSPWRSCAYLMFVAWLAQSTTFASHVLFD